MDRNTIVVIVLGVLILVIFSVSIGLFAGKISGNLGDANGQQWQDAVCPNGRCTYKCGGSPGYCGGIDGGPCYSGSPNYPKCPGS